MDGPNYYRILGIDRNASGDEIKRAYRRQAKRYHPDVSDDPDGERKFKAVAEAYRMLKGRQTDLAQDSRNLHGRTGKEQAPSINPLDLWCDLFLWPAWGWFWLR